MKWFRLYDEILDDPKVQMLPGEQFKFWINLMALANRSAVRGVIELSCQHIAWTLHLDPALTAQYLGELTDAGLLEECEDRAGVTPHNWSARQYKSDDATARSNEWRGKKNVAENDVSNKEGEGAILHATLQEQERNVSASVSVNSVNLESDSVNTKGGAGGTSPTRKTRAAPKVDLADNFTPAFEGFWEQYPRDRDGMKAGQKSKARDEFRKVSVAEWDDVMAGLACYKRLSKVQRGYVLNAERWLKERKWVEALTAEPLPEVHENGQDKPSKLARSIANIAREYAGLDEVPDWAVSGANENYQARHSRKLIEPPKAG